MFRIRRILEASTPANKAVIAQVQDIMRAQFKQVKEKHILNIPDKLNNPLKYRFQTRLFVAEKGDGPIIGFGLMLYMPDVGCSFLDFVATGANQMGRGLGGALYERIREEAYRLNSRALFLECLPDDPELSPKEEIRKENIKRLRFYERYGVYPIEGSLYETPVTEDGIDPPYILIDLLGNEFPDKVFLKKAIHAILERNYLELCPDGYIENVVKSFNSPDVKLRAPRYVKKINDESVSFKEKDKIVYIANEKHDIHHVKDRGYVESPVRVRVIMRELEKLPFLEKAEAKTYPDQVLLSVHDPDYVSYLKKACLSIEEKKSVYPYIFPIRNTSRQPKEMAVRAGYYCIDTFTPLNANAYKAARAAVNCALTGADFILSGRKAAYALTRPPGHHAERKSFGGFCYFANAAIAAQYLSKYGKVAILDIDYHHGNSQQDIFYDRSDVLTVSLHGDPKVAYPYFTGFAEEVGQGDGCGFNINMPLPEHISPEDYLKQVNKAIKSIKDFDPEYFIIALGLDTAKADPTGTWSLRTENFNALGEMLGQINIPTLIVQEGGYRTQTLGINARHFFSGFHKGLSSNISKLKLYNKGEVNDFNPKIRKKLRLSDVEKTRELIKSIGIFNEQEITVAGEMAAESILKGDSKSEYSFSILEENDSILGYACYGLVPFTESTYDLNWIVVNPRYQRKKLATQLLEDIERSIKTRGGKVIYAETSSLSGYSKARSFFISKNFIKCSEYTDFYGKGNSKIVFKKIIQ